MILSIFKINSPKLNKNFIENSLTQSIKENEKILFDSLLKKELTEEDKKEMNNIKQTERSTSQVNL